MDAHAKCPPTLLSEEEIREIQSNDPRYTIHYNNLQEETKKESKRLKNVPQNGRRLDRRPPLAFHPVQCASERAVERHTRAPRYSSAEYRESS